MIYFHELPLHLILAWSCASLARAALYTDPSLIGEQYDFVIVGAGVAGNVLANRLSETEAFSVLVIEAGISNTEVIADEVPFLDTTLSPNTSVTWNYTTTEQIGLFNRTIPYPRGRVLGGSSTINYCIWTRGSVDDYERYSQYTNDSGWSWNELYPYMLKSERLVPPSDHHDSRGQVIPFIHGTDGPIHTSLVGYPTPLDQRVFETTYDLWHDFPLNMDSNSGYPLGVGWTVVSVTTSGRRSSSSTGYLEPVLDRRNLDVLIQTQVTKLISQNISEAPLIFSEVEMAQSSTSKRYIVRARKEVILSAGSIGTPQILQLSGIGDPELLEKVGISLVLNLTDVGKNLVDHPLLPSQWLVNASLTWDEIRRNETYAEDLFREWNITGAGPYVDPASVQIIFTRLENETEVLSHFDDPSAGPASPHIEILPDNAFVSFSLDLPDIGNYMSMITIVVSPASRGSVTLASSNPFESPLIDPGFLSDPFDVYTMIQAVKDARKFLNASAWDGYVISEYSDLANAQTDAEIEVYVRNYTSTVWHPVGTARMSAASSEEGVLTPSLLVKGTKGLRVVDASVLPYIPSAHPQACIYAFAERAADLIKAAWM